MKRPKILMRVGVSRGEGRTPRLNRGNFVALKKWSMVNIELSTLTTLPATILPKTGFNPENKLALHQQDIGGLSHMHDQVFGLSK